MSTYYKIAIVVLALVLLGVIAWFFLLRPASFIPGEPQNLDDILTAISGQNSNQFISNTNSQVVTSGSVEPSGVDLAIPSIQEQTQVDIENRIQFFVEQWGTYSNQTDLSNLLSLAPLMTGSMQGFIDDYQNSIRQEYPYLAGYFGITTKVIVVTIDDYSSESTSLMATVGTRRTQKNVETTQTINQEAWVVLRQIGGEWLVDSVVWLNE